MALLGSWGHGHEQVRPRCLGSFSHVSQTQSEPLAGPWAELSICAWNLTTVHTSTGPCIPCGSRVRSHPSSAKWPPCSPSGPSASASCSLFLAPPPESPRAGSSLFEVSPHVTPAFQALDLGVRQKPEHPCPLIPHVSKIRPRFIQQVPRNWAFSPSGHTACPQAA